MLHPIIFWTDIPIYLMVVCVVLMIRSLCIQSTASSTLHTLVQQPLAMVALVTVCMYLIIGLMDSLHFYLTFSTAATAGTHHPLSNQTVYSVLDYLASGITKHHEISYSAPFAHRTFQKYLHIDAQGHRQFVYQKLHYALSSSNKNTARNALRCGLYTVSASVVVWTALSSGITYALARHQKCPWSRQWRHIWQGNTRTTWRSTLLCFGLYIALINFILFFAPHYHILGTDKIGNDTLYQALKSIRTGLIIGGLTLCIMLPCAIILGISSGYFGGWIDHIIQYVYTTLSAVPSVLLISAAMLTLNLYISRHTNQFVTLDKQADLQLLILCLVLALTGWSNLCRLLRGETLKLREMDYIKASYTMGTSTRRILFNHILPNTMHIILLSAVIDFSGLILAEAVLSYIGIGVAPTTISWGNMINNARSELARTPSIWWPLLAAFISMLPLVLSTNILAETLRTLWEPTNTSSNNL